MISQKLLKSLKKAIKFDIKRLEGEVKEYRKFKHLGTTNEDNALEFEAFEESLSLSKLAEKELKELKKALERIEEGKYGICKKCSGVIEAGRLKVYPAATTCATHAKDK
ncbi:MAG: hypothetical protein OEV37_01470 [Candidatus Berkelbacteria bacterium]|nr:hypothetical protein [Candidatus Berkelbacteria bacterium]